MRQVAKKGLLTVVATGGVLPAAGGGAAYADAGAAGVAAGSPGVVSGNAVQVPVHVPVNAVRQHGRRDRPAEPGVRQHLRQRLVRRRPRYGRRRDGRRRRRALAGRRLRQHRPGPGARAGQRVRQHGRRGRAAEPGVRQPLRQRGRRPTRAAHIRRHPAGRAPSPRAPWSPGPPRTRAPPAHARPDPGTPPAHPGTPGNARHPGGGTPRARDTTPAARRRTPGTQTLAHTGADGMGLTARLGAARCCSAARCSTAAAGPPGADPAHRHAPSAPTGRRPSPPGHPAHRAATRRSLAGTATRDAGVRLTMSRAPGG